MMKCSKCRAELSDDAKFCLYCGNKINVTTPSSTEEDSDSFKASHPEIAWSNGDKADAPKSLADKIKAKASDKWHKLSIYGKITTVALSVFVLLCLVALLFGKTAATMIAILQIVLTVTALLMKKQVIKVSQSWLHIVAFVFAAFLLVPYVSLFGMDYGEDDSKMNIGAEASEEYGTLMWSDSTIANLLPIPKSITGKITQDNEKEFTAYVSNTPIEEFNAYVASCADKGFTVDVSEAEQSFSAQNADGYRLSVSYQGNGVMSVSVSEPEYAVSLEIECVENLLFSKYDVDVYLDDFKQGTISHGTNETFNLNLTKGTYEIKFVSAEDDGVTGGVSIDIHQDESLKYKISCTSSQINVETIQGTISEHGEDEAAMPRSASSYVFKNYADVQTELTEAGFTNISFEILYDIVIGWTEEGEVDSVSVDGNTEFEQGDIFKKDIAIVITYHMPEEDDPNKPVENETESFAEPAENLTVENCPDLEAVLTLRDPGDSSVAAFANKYYGQIIEFDGCVMNMQHHGNFKTRWDVLLGAGDYDENSALGPNFRLTDVNFHDMNISGADSVYAGLNVHIVAEVGDYNPNSQLFELDIISMNIRN